MNKTVKIHTFPNTQILAFINGDITQEPVDAIVNAANERLMHGGGVAGIMARRGGSEIIKESQKWIATHGLVTHKKPAYTTGGKLPCRFIIHAVGPIWGSGDEDLKLHQAVTGSLKCADQLNLSTLAFPAISTGIFGFPKPRAAKVIIMAIAEYFKVHKATGITQVRLVLFGDEDTRIFLDTFEKIVNTDWI